MFVMKTFVRSRSIVASISSRNFPAAPTKGLPCWSSFFPGPSPIRRILAFLLPTPGTVCVLCSQSLHNWQSLGTMIMCTF